MRKTAQVQRSQARAGVATGSKAEKTGRNPTTSWHGVPPGHPIGVSLGGPLSLLSPQSCGWRSWPGQEATKHPKSLRPMAFHSQCHHLHCHPGHSCATLTLAQPAGVGDKFQASVSGTLRFPVTLDKTRQPTRPASLRAGPTPRDACRLGHSRSPSRYVEGSSRLLRSSPDSGCRSGLVRKQGARRCDQVSRGHSRLRGPMPATGVLTRKKSRQKCEDRCDVSMSQSPAGGDWAPRGLHWASDA